MKPLRLFFRPRSTIRSAYEKPSIPLAVALVLSPTIFVVLVSLFYGISVAMPALAFSVAQELVFWFTGGISFYILLRVLKGRLVSGKFFGVLTAFSLLYLVRLAITALFFCATVIAAPMLLPQISALQGMDLASGEMASQLAGVPSAPAPGVFAVMGVAFLLSAVLMIFGLYVLYQVIAQASPGSRAKNILIFVLQIGLLMLAQSVIWPLA